MTERREFSFRSIVTFKWTSIAKLAGISILPLLTTGCMSLFMWPDRIERVTPDDLGLDYEDVWLTAEDGLRLHVWHLKAEKPRVGVVVFFHGNAQNNSAHIASVYWLPKHGFDVFMLDPRGYGRSEGEADIGGLHRDAAVALEHVAAEACGEIIVFGQSLGGAMGIYTAAHSRALDCVRGVVTESAFASYRRVARDQLASSLITWPLQWPLSFLVHDRYSPRSHVARISPTPLLVVHGAQDDIVRPHHGRRLYEAAGAPRELWLLPEAGHIGLVIDEEGRERLANWMHEVLGAQVELSARDSD
jgi:uncharacterized protein